MSRHAATTAAVDLASQYRAATSGTVVAERPDVGRVLFAGQDAADILHRLSTNAIAGLPPGGGTATVFTTNKGRILDLVTVHRIDAGLLAMGAAARMPTLVHWVDRYTFREQVTAADWGASHRTLGLYGPGAAALAGRLWGPEAASLPLHHALRVEAGGAAAWLVRTFALAGDGYLLTAEAGSWTAVRGALPGDVREIGAECVEILRVLAGLPAFPNELNDEHNPWEARLHDAIALDKGCYVGQEVIARLDTYKKVARQLVRIRLAAGVPATGAEVRAGGEVVGTVTSAVGIPDGSGGSAALAYVRERDAGAGRAVSIAAGKAGLAGTIEGVAR
jgi:tRNA-modifying protein YgfZ